MYVYDYCPNLNNFLFAICCFSLPHRRDLVNKMQCIVSLSCLIYIGFILILYINSSNLDMFILFGYFYMYKNLSFSVIIWLSAS